MLWKGNVKGGVIHVYRTKPFNKDEIWFDLTIDEIEGMLKIHANSNWVFLSLVRERGKCAIERWIRESPTNLLMLKRKENWDGDVYGEDQAIALVKKLYTKYTGNQPISIYEQIRGGAL